MLKFRFGMNSTEQLFVKKYINNNRSIVTVFLHGSVRPSFFIIRNLGVLLYIKKTVISKPKYLALDSIQQR